MAPRPQGTLWMGEAVPFSLPVCLWLNGQGWVVVPPGLVLRSNRRGSDGASRQEPGVGLGGGRGILGSWWIGNRAPGRTRTLPRVVTPGH